MTVEAKENFALKVIDPPRAPDRSQAETDADHAGEPLPLHVHGRCHRVRPGKSGRMEKNFEGARE
jgi:hypothetical protein